ncbi:MAG: Ig-like domain-containing protein [Gammaproteobacteria bacterium]|nr:Ig-like domain-containing protein [Gammaproteobacteria bacterium]
MTASVSSVGVSTVDVQYFPFHREPFANSSIPSCDWYTSVLNHFEEYFMKKIRHWNYRAMIVPLICIFAFSGLWHGQASAQTIRILPTDDVIIDPNNADDIINGRGLEVAYSNFPTFSPTRRSLLRFEVLNDVDLSNAAVVIEIVGALPTAAVQLGLYAADDNWREDSITWNSRPGRQSALQSLTIASDSARTLRFDAQAVRDYLVGEQPGAEETGDGVASFWLELESVDGVSFAGNVVFQDREGSLDAPSGSEPHIDTGVEEVIDADLALRKTSNAASVNVGENIIYTIVVANNGPSAATNVVMSDTLPTNVTLVTASSELGACTEANHTVTCALGDLGNGDTISATIETQTSIAETVTNTARVAATTNDPDLLNNTDSVNTEVLPLQVDLQVSKTASNDPVTADSAFTYVVTASNTGPGDATNVMVEDTLPPTVTFDSATSDQGTCSEAGGVVTCALGTLAASASAEMHIQVTAPGLTNNLLNTVSIQADQEDTNTENNTFMLTTAMQPGAATNIAVSADPASLPADGASTSTVTAVVTDANGNPVAGADVSFATTLGTVEATVATDANGEATATLTAATTTGTATITATAGDASDSTTVEFVTGDAANIAVTASPDILTADGSSISIITARVTDDNGNPIEGTTVDFTTTSGSIDPASATTNADGIATATLTAATATGTATVTASSGEATGSTNVEFVAGDPATVAVTANPDTVTADGSSTSTITAVVTDANGNPIAGTEVSFATTLGAIATTATTDANGVATVTLTASTTAGTATVSATAGTASGSADVVFTSGPAANMAVNADPATLPANGSSTSTISALITDANGNPVAGESVDFATTLGAIDPGTATTNDQGIAVATLTSTTSTGTATVSATANGITNSTAVPFLAGGPSNVAVSADPTTLTADGSSTSTISALVTDENGNPLSGQEVTFETTAGTIDLATATTGANGVATATLTSSTTAGTATVSATADSAVGTTDVEFSAGAPATIAVSAEPTSLTADGSSTSAISAVVTDANGNPVAGAEVSFATTTGAVNATATTAENGVATATLTAPTTAGTATVTATADAASGSTDVTFVAGSAANAAVSADPPALPADGSSTSTITAVITDENGNPVSGETVTFATALGSIDPATATTDENGVATTTLTAATTAGTATVNAIAGAASGATEVQFSAGAAGNVAVSADPTTLPADGSSTSAVTARVTDANGNPLAGEMVIFATNLGSIDSATATTDGDGVATATLTAATTAGTATVNATAGGAGGSTDVEFSAGAAANIGVTAEPATVPADGVSTSMITARVTDVNGNPVAGESVTFATTLGDISPTSATTNANGEATATLTSAITVGTATVSASASGTSGVTDVAFVTGAAANVAVTADPAALPADGASTSIINVQVTDDNGNPIAGATVDFATTLGSIEPIVATTDENGVATATLTAATTTGTATVSATAGSASGTTDVAFVAGTAANVEVGADPTTLTADGSSTSAISARVTDANGNPVAGETVNFATTLGAIDPTTATTNANGVATATLTAASSPGTANVTAVAGAANGSTNVDFVVGSAANVDVTANPTTLTADGSSTSAITARVTDANGNPIAGESVTFQTTGGTIAPAAATTDANGEANATLTASTSIETATVTASADATSNSVDVDFVAGAAANVVVSATPTTLPADGSSTSIISAQVTDANGNPVIGQSVNFATTLGGMAPATATTDANGIATATLTAASASGTATVSADTGAASGSTTIAFVAGGPANVTVSAEPTTLIADGSSTSTITAQVTDATGNPVASETVSFATTTGNIDATAVTDANGMATATLTAGTTTGTATVSATAGPASDSVDVALVAGTAANLTVTADPVTLPADGTSTSAIMASVTDANGNPIAGATVTLTTDLGTLSAPSITTDANGNATATLTSSAITGTATVVGNLGTLTDSVQVTFVSIDQPVEINDAVTLGAVSTGFSGTPEPNAPAGVFTISANFTNNTTDTTLSNIYFKVAELSRNNLLLNADGGPGGVGSIISVTSPASVAPGESFTIDFRIGLATRRSFSFFVDAFGLTASTASTSTVRGQGQGFKFMVEADEFEEVQQIPLYLPMIAR